MGQIALPGTERARRERIQAAPHFLYVPATGGAPIPPTPWPDGTNLRHLIIFPCRVLRAVAGRHKLEATACGGAAARPWSTAGGPGRRVQAPGEGG